MRPPLATLVLALAAAGALAAVGPTAPAAPRPVERAISRAAAVGAIFAERAGLRPPGDVALVVAAWDDGRVIWSGNQQRGGPPYRAGSCDRSRLAALITRLGADGAFSDPALARAWFGPDSSYTTILVRAAGRQLQMRSWHELYEGPRTIATSAGLEELGGRDPAAVIAADRPEYRRFRAAWDRLRADLLALRPPTSRSARGSLLMRRGEVVWREAPPAK